MMRKRIVQKLGQNNLQIMNLDYNAIRLTLEKMGKPMYPSRDNDEVDIVLVVPANYYRIFGHPLTFIMEKLERKK